MNVVMIQKMAQHELSIRSGLRAQRDCTYDDFYVNKKRLSDILKITDPITPFGWLGTEQVSQAELEDRFARMLLGTAASDLRADTVPLFICGECADYGCGATTCRVTVSDMLVEWSDFGWDNNHENETKRRLPRLPAASCKRHGNSTIIAKSERAARQPVATL